MKELGMHVACREEAHGEGKVEERTALEGAVWGYGEVTRNGIKNADERITITRQGVTFSCKVRRK